MAKLNIITLGSSKNYTDLAALGLTNVVVNDQDKTISFTLVADGSTRTLHFDQPSDGKDGQDGISITGVNDLGNGKFTLLFSDGSESDPIQTVKGQKGDKLTFNDLTDAEKASLKGSDGFSPSAKIEKVGDTATITITDKDGTTTATIKDGQGGSGGGTVDVPIEKIKVNGELQTPVNKVVDITVPDAYDDTALVQRISNIESDYVKSSDIPTKVSQLENDSNYLSSIPEEYVTDTELEAKGYLTEHQDISGKVDKVEGKSLIADTEIERLASVDNYDDTALDNRIKAIEDDYVKTADIPTKVSVLTNDSNYQTAEQVSSTVTTEIAKVVADAPESLNTLKEMSDWIAGHEEDASAMNSAISDNKTAITALQTGKADKSEIPTTVAELTDSADYAKTADVNDSISTLQTGKADASDLTAHTDDTDIHVTADDKTLWNTVSDKVDKEDGKGLSANDYTNEEKVLVGTIEDKINKTSIATALDDTVTDEQVASALLTKTELDKKIDKTSIVTELSDTSTDDEVVGALTAYNELQKLESANKEQFSTASGDYITVNDSVDGNIIELGIKGNSVQQSYSGKNLLNATLQTTELNGVTCTNNGDGTYTLNGKVIDRRIIFFNIGTYTLEKNKTYKFIGMPDLGLGFKCYVDARRDNDTQLQDIGSGDIHTSKNGQTGKPMRIVIDGESYSDIVLNNVLIKPMITTDLNATYDDFVPYTGDGDTLAADVAEIKNDLGGLTFSASGTTLSITDGTNTWTLEANS